MISNTSKKYLAFGGMFLPGLLLVGFYGVFSKKPVSLKEPINFILLTGGSAIGAYITLKIMNNLEPAKKAVDKKSK
jgi:hypothetical protein